MNQLIKIKKNKLQIKNQYKDWIYNLINIKSLLKLNKIQNNH